MTSSDGNVSVDYAWDELNPLSTVVDHRLNGSNTTTYAYDSASNLATATYPNAIQTTFWHPFSAHLNKGIWKVEGHLPDGVDGGVAEVWTNKQDGKTVRVSHGK